MARKNTQFMVIFLIGPNLIESCRSSSMVTSPNGEGVILFGCGEENPEEIYELINTNGTLYWKRMLQKLKYPRSSSISMLVPDELVTCSE